MTTPTPPADAPTPRTDALKLRPDTLQHARFEGCDSVILAPEDFEALYALTEQLETELAAKDARIAALEKDKALLDEFESLCRCDDVQAHQISEDECEPELLGHYWGTPTVQSCSVREAMKAAIAAAMQKGVRG